MPSRQLSGRADFLLHMFYVRYLRNELVRRRARTILTLLGLGLGVAQVTTGLTLLAEHQEGIVPKIVAKLKTGGQTFDITRNIPRPTAAQFRQMQACFDKLRSQNGSSGSGSGAGSQNGFGGNGGGLGGAQPGRGAF